MADVGDLRADASRGIGGDKSELLGESVADYLVKHASTQATNQRNRLIYKDLIEPSR